MGEKHAVTEGLGFLDQHIDRYHPVAADLSAAGMGSFQDMQRLLVLPLQRDFQEKVPGDDGGGDLPPTAGQPLVYLTLYDRLLDLFLELAGALRFAFGKCPMPDFFRRHDG